MKGYFFRLAQQTGLRFKPNTSVAHSGGMVEPRGESSAHARFAPKPLHREENVFVSQAQTQTSPNASGRATDNSAPTPLKNHAAEAEARARNPSNQAAQNFSVRESNPAHTQAFEPEGARLFSRAPFDAPLFAGRIQIQETQAVIEQSAAINETSASPENTGMLLQPATDSPSAGEVSSASAHASDAALAAPEIREPLIAQEPEHFKETAALLESGVQDKELLQNIFLKEIHEWIAAPAGSELDAAHVKPPPALDEKLRHVARIEPDAEVAFEPPRARAKERERERLEQHDLSLSIGSISIVIEEPPPSQQPSAAPPQAATRAESSQQGSREFSRLSRHYIR
jgi:hypothetical protein